MAWPTTNHIEQLITQANRYLAHVQVVIHDVDNQRAVFRLEAKWQSYRIVVQEIHRPDGSMRYAYCVLDDNNKQVHRFDNSGDRYAIKLRYKTDWKPHQHEEIPHQHDEQGRISLTEPITFEQFVSWLNQR